MPLLYFVCVFIHCSVRVSLGGGALPLMQSSPSVSSSLPPVSAITPLHVEQFAWELRNHPNQPQVSFVLEGLRDGFRLGYFYPRKLRSASRNKPSAHQHPEVVDSYLANEAALGRVAGPFEFPPLPGLHISSFGVLPKRGQPGKWRLIVDLSSPHGSSVNDGISEDEFTMQYIHLDQIIGMVSQHGRGGHSWLSSMWRLRIAIFPFTL